MPREPLPLDLDSPVSYTLTPRAEQLLELAAALPARRHPPRTRAAHVRRRRGERRVA